MKMLLSIKPEFAKEIITGKKKFEFRKFRCRDEVQRILLYSTRPQKQVIAEADLEHIIEGTVAQVWEETKDFAGIDREYYDLYYHGKDKAYAYQLANVRVFDRPMSLSELGVSCAPQSHCYI